MGSFFVIVRKTALAAAYLCVIATGISFGFPRWQQSNQLKKKHAALQETIEQRRQEIRQLKRNHERMAWDKPFVEGILREKRRIYPGEIVFFIHDSEEP